jgi:hypothetical protein
MLRLKVASAHLSERPGWKQSTIILDSSARLLNDDLPPVFNVLSIIAALSVDG